MRLLFASSHDPNLLHVFPGWISDPIMALVDEDSSRIFLDQREYDHARELGYPRVQVERSDEFIAEARRTPTDGPFWGKVLVALCRAYALQSVEVAANFPYDLGKYLETQGIRVEVLPELFPERRTKSLVEIQHIETVQRATEAAFYRIHEILSDARIGAGDVLIYQEQEVTSEFLKKVVAMTLLEHDAYLQEGLIISHGTQAAIPHHTGHGVLRAHESIVCDIFPRSTTSFYFADMTRTFCKGEPSDHLRRMYDAVKQVQEEACQMVAPGVDASTIHAHCQEVFRSHGFVTTAEEGFVHSTGHGVGLEIHEQPRVSSASCILLPGDVITIEPGLYYPAWGGVRIEDMMYVKEDGARNLTQFVKELVVS